MDKLREKKEEKLKSNNKNKNKENKGLSIWEESV